MASEHTPGAIEGIATHTSPEDFAEEKDAEHDAKRQRSTTNTPRSDPARAWAPRDYDNLMGVGSVGFLQMRRITLS